ncbi:MAG: hypothetical protein ACR2FV_01650 [Ornithinimicrobium sp.]|jgi:hypothetical protein|uniref:hypothetical protein n=1 Tax=Ornithinimicrobium sp. TaxID=1977084 RepID=UPI003D9B94C1
MPHIDTRRPFTRKQADEAGLSWRYLAGPKVRRLFRNVYVSAALVPGVELLVGAARELVGEHACASHHTAALLWGGVVPHSSDVHVTVPTGCVRNRSEGVHVHAADREQVDHRGQPVTTPADTFVDLGRYLELVDLVVLGDSLVKAGVTTPEELIEAARTATGRGARTVRRAAAYVRVGVDSPMETRARLLMVLAGLPEPAVNHVLRDDSGVVRRRLDLSYPQFRLAIEYDGRQHAENSAQWQGDVRRREQLDQWQWRLVVLLSGDIYTSPGQTLQRIRAAMESCGMKVPAQTEEWRRHFPGRQAA